MNIGHLIGCLTSKVSLIQGGKGDIKFFKVVNVVIP